MFLLIGWFEPSIRHNFEYAALFLWIYVKIRSTLSKRGCKVFHQVAGSELEHMSEQSVAGFGMCCTTNHYQRNVAGFAGDSVPPEWSMRLILAPD